MRKILKTGVFIILFMIICTGSASAFPFDGNMDVPRFTVDGVVYMHDYGSTDVEMEGSYLEGSQKTLNIPETVEYENQKYTVTNVHFDDYIDGFSECVYTIETINICENLKVFYTTDTYRSRSGAWKNLKKINIPKNSKLKEIHSFVNCPNLKSVYIPAAVTNLYFKNCPNLKMTISKDNPKYKMRNTRYLCSKNGKKVYSYFGKQKNVTIPKRVTTLENAYSDNNYIKSVTMPKSVKTIKYCAFSNCKKLSKVVINNKKKSPKIEKNAFKNTKKGIKFYVKNKKVAKSLKKQLKGSGVKKAKILIGSKVIYKNIK